MHAPQRQPLCGAPLVGPLLPNPTKASLLEVPASEAPRLQKRRRWCPVDVWRGTEGSKSYEHSETPQSGFSGSAVLRGAVFQVGAHQGDGKWNLPSAGVDTAAGQGWGGAGAA
ncbi:unnamed protein product [Rangifer tarandus platyrhynchus]|uniref:Uncharacterized protein n=2 Tax=Rangifer tarandus platyrhynchus TaxID=3082113 RepID=A0ABN8YW73_RANTA|nr:unnamed protein product [Rangifer tarandus platyrhynchus]CAI9702401.1 unnamed protein product [Rangifer tarandus platyrhynchus]